ncbi:hypothetical protein EZS27_029538 [termite gut metagenome]|uniref:Uncharacterized protein n=1 Tax=termite gut metagenome TaxID=433724 RepID=A0A5J4QG20_9ZZZZ
MFAGERKKTSGRLFPFPHPYDEYRQMLTGSTPYPIGETAGKKHLHGGRQKGAGHQTTLFIPEDGREFFKGYMEGYPAGGEILVQGKQSSCAWTHGVCNFTLGTLSLENQYGKMTGERLKSMFNFIEPKGESRRK